MKNPEMKKKLLGSEFNWEEVVIHLKKYEGN